MAQNVHTSFRASGLMAARKAGKNWRTPTGGFKSTPNQNVFTRERARRPHLQLTGRSREIGNVGVSLTRSGFRSSADTPDQPIGDAGPGRTFPPSRHWDGDVSSSAELPHLVENPSDFQNSRSSSPQILTMIGSGSFGQSPYRLFQLSPDPGRPMELSSPDGVRKAGRGSLRDADKSLQHQSAQDIQIEKREEFLS